MKPETPLLIYLHIPKTGGRTLEWMILEKEYPATTAFRIDNTRLHDERKRLQASGRAPPRLVTGHIGFGWHRAFDRPVQYITLLRDPVARVVSLYRHVHRDPNHPLNSEVSRMTLRQFVDSRILERETDNGQTRLLAGLVYGWEDGPCGRESGPVTEEALTTAQNHLAEHFLMAGITEHFDESLLLMSSLLGWSHHYYARQNVSKDSKPCSADSLELIAERNLLDQRLYDQACQQLDERTQEAGRPFQRKLLRFRRRNRLYAAAYPFLRPFRRLLGSSRV